MHLDVEQLRAFYYRSALGRAAQASLREALRELWPEAKGQTVAGFGFALPVLRPYLRDARRVLALMPGPQGVMAWPAGQPNVAVLTEETLWPVETGHVDKLIMLHGLESSERPALLLEEAWRVLGPGGKALFVVPNRAGLWSRSDATPFGYGRPYTLGQLESQLKAHDFVPSRHNAALYRMPSEKRFWNKSGALFEKIGRRLPTVLVGGALIVEATKRSPAKPDLPLKPKEKATVLPKGFPEPAIRSADLPGG